jgi:hypothetical protein
MKPLTTVLGLRPLQRRPELDALRGLFLVWMTLTHLPTHFSDLVNQPFGFISSAEGFVFLSALLVARLYIRQAAEDHVALRTKLFKRTLRIYGYHLVMLALAFTVAAAFAVTTHRMAITNLLDFYLAHPFTAIVGSVLLIYCPPLLDILPMYVSFLLITPYLLAIAARRGWKGILIGSGFIWMLAQFGLRSWVHGLVVHATGLKIPLQETGAFNLFAWQAIWISGMAIGAASADGSHPFRRLPRFSYPLSAAICLFLGYATTGWDPTSPSRRSASSSTSGRSARCACSTSSPSAASSTGRAGCSPISPCSSRWSPWARPRSRSSAPTSSLSSSVWRFSTGISASYTASTPAPSSWSPSAA